MCHSTRLMNFRMNHNYPLPFPDANDKREFEELPSRFELCEAPFKLLEPPSRLQRARGLRAERDQWQQARAAHCGPLKAAGAFEASGLVASGSLPLGLIASPIDSCGRNFSFALIGTMIGSSEAVAAPPPSGMACCSQAWDAAQPRTAGERLSRRLRRNTLPGRAELGREPEATQLWLRRGEA